jgi:carbamoyl-phosphate synthase small subunit
MTGGACQTPWKSSQKMIDLQSLAMNARIILENGLVLRGRSFGSEGMPFSFGEVVFNTSLTGYQEILTDPSYCGQIVIMTNPLIGNYGINEEDMESRRSHIAGFLVKEYSGIVSNQRATGSLGDWLTQQGIPAIQGIDTRMLTRIIRESGAMRGLIAFSDEPDAKLLERVRSSPGMAGADLTRRVTCEASYTWDQVDTTPFALEPSRPEVDGARESYRVVVYDFGIKLNILRRLRSYGCAVTVVPSNCSAEEVLRMKPDGIFLSNGPGDPAAVTYAIENTRKLIGTVPLFGICLGHQILALALGGRTFKLKFGHRGANHPVKNLLTGAIEITSQNHGFAVDPDSLSPSLLEITHVNLNDGTNEGFRHRTVPLFSVQYHPEASPGPHDSDYLFGQFIELMRRSKQIRN